jgi:hypothetical protein
VARRVHEARKDEWSATRQIEQEKIDLEEEITTLHKYVTTHAWLDENAKLVDQAYSLTTIIFGGATACG